MTKSTRFDGVMRSLRATPSRRQALAALLGILPGLFLTTGPDVSFAANEKKARRKRRRRKDRRPGDGACGPDSTPGKGCRCKKRGESCADDANCCPGTQHLSCQAGACQPCDVCRAGCTFTSVQTAIDVAAAGDTIQLCAGVFGEQLVIRKDVTLIGVGDGEQGTTLDGLQSGSTVSVNDATVTLERLRITGGGAGFGGGILSQKSTLTLTACTVSGNTADLFGGGISTIALSADQPSVLILNDSTVADNESGTSGGGIDNRGFSTTTLNTSIVRGNKAGQQGGGISLNGGAVTLTNSRVENNTAGFRGGGIFRVRGSLTLNDSTVANNEPDNCAGGVSGCA